MRASVPARASRRWKLPALHNLVHGYVPTDSDARVVVVTHVLPTARAYLDCLAQKFSIQVIAIPYSSSPSTAGALKTTSGHHVIRPSSLDEIPTAVLQAIQQAAVGGRPVVLQEIGGYLAEHVRELGTVGSFRGVVEDTNNGHWRYEAARDDLAFPVLSIAQSPIKAMEVLQVGNAVCFSLERVLREAFHDVITGAAVLVLGYGGVGSACAAAFHRRGANVLVSDIDRLRLMRAHLDGYQVGPVSKLLRAADIVVGATGRCSIDAETLQSVRSGTIIASASSRQIEIDLETLQSSCRISRVADSVHKYRMGRRYVYLVSDGYPVNFRDQSILGPILDAIYCELFVCLREVLEGAAPVGMNSSWPSLHQEVAAAWLDAYTRGGSSRPVSASASASRAVSHLAGGVPARAHPRVGSQVVG